MKKVRTNRHQSQLPPLDPLTEGYLVYLHDIGRKSPRTVIDVRCTLRKIIAALEERRPGVPLWKLALVDYLGWLEAERSAGRSAACLGKYLSHLRGLLEYAWRNRRADRNVLDGFQIQDQQVRRQVPAALTVEEAWQLVKGCPKSTVAERRDRVAILLLYGCGLRTAELCQLNVSDVHGPREELLVRHGKGDRERVVPIPPGVLPEVLSLQVERGGRRGPLLRTLTHRRRLSAKDVCEIVAQAAARAGLPSWVTPKVLRHSYATHLMDREVNLAVVSSLLGHRSPAETGVYLHLLNKPMPGAIQQRAAAAAAAAMEKDQGGES
jgi:site-specific recombinase XerD